MASKLSRAREAAKRAREKAAEGRRMAVRRASTAGAGFIIGSMERSGALESIPQIAGVPRMVILAGVGVVGGMYAKGAIGDALDGLGDAALAIGAYQLGNSGSVSGAETVIDDVPELDEARIHRLAEELADAEISGYEEELDAVLSGVEEEEQEP